MSKIPTIMAANTPAHKSDTNGNLIMRTQSGNGVIYECKSIDEYLRILHNEFVYSAVGHFTSTLIIIVIVFAILQVVKRAIKKL